MINNPMFTVLRQSRNWSLAIQVLSDSQLIYQYRIVPEIYSIIINDINEIEIDSIFREEILLWYEYTEALLEYGEIIDNEMCLRKLKSAFCDKNKIIETPYWAKDERFYEIKNYLSWLRWVDRETINMSDYEYPTRQVQLFPSGEEGSPPFSSLIYPRMGSIKYDGTFCLVYNGELYTRRLKFQPNQFLRKRFESLLAYSKDNQIVFMGEIYDPSKKFNEGQSIVRSYAGELFETSFYIFDCLPERDWKRGTGGMPFYIRYDTYTSAVQSITNTYIKAIEQVDLKNEAAAIKMYNKAIEDGYEGLVTRSPRGYYKHGRCTAKDQDLFRHRKIGRCEGKILAINQGKKLKDGVSRNILLNGLLDRPHKNEDYIPDNIAGSIEVLTESGITCAVGFGKGWTIEDRRKFWGIKEILIGKIIEIEYNANENKTALRQPKFVRLRNDK